MGRPGCAGRAQAMVRAAFFANEEEKLSTETLKRLYGEFTRFSVSRLQTFAQCPYQYFLNYGLHLRERMIMGVDDAQIGTVLHAAMDGYTSHVLTAGLAFDEISEEDRERFSKEAMEEALLAAEDTGISDTARYRYLTKRLTRVFKRTVEMVTAQIADGTFQVVGHELPFTVEGKDGTYALAGTIDRLDTARMEDEDGNQKLGVRIVDYKTGDKTVSPEELYYGRQMQLMFYMHAAIDMLKEQTKDAGEDLQVVPSAMMYYRMYDPMLESKDVKDRKKKEMDNGTPVDDTQAFWLEMRDKTVMHGMLEGGTEHEKANAGAYTAKDAVSAEDLKTCMDYAVFKSEKMIEEINDGMLSPQPMKIGSKSSCQYCVYAGICMRDDEIPGFETETPESLKPAEYYTRMRADMEGEDA